MSPPHYPSFLSVLTASDIYISLVLSIYRQSDFQLNSARRHIVCDRIFAVNSPGGLEFSPAPLVMWFSVDQNELIPARWVGIRSLPFLGGLGCVGGHFMPHCSPYSWGFPARPGRGPSRGAGIAQRRRYCALEVETQLNTKK